MKIDEDGFAKEFDLLKQLRDADDIQYCCQYWQECSGLHTCEHGHAACSVRMCGECQEEDDIARNRY